MPDRKTEAQTYTISELAREFDMTQRAGLCRLSNYRGSR